MDEIKLQARFRCSQAAEGIESNRIEWNRIPTVTVSSDLKTLRAFFALFCLLLLLTAKL